MRSHGDYPLKLHPSKLKLSDMTAIELDIHRWTPHVHENEENLHAHQNSTNIIHSIPTFYSFGQNDSMERPTFDLEVASCGMPKNTRLPIPETNYSLTDGSFGDDAGFTMIGFHKHFLGKGKTIESIFKVRWFFFQE